MVFDTQAVVQAALSPREPAESEGVRLMDEDRIEVFMSNRLRAEYETTLSHPELRARFPHVSPPYVSRFLDRFDRKAHRVANPPSYVEFPRDRNDEPVLNLAVHVEADFIVSNDPDLKNLDREPSWRHDSPHSDRLAGGTAP